MNKRILTLLGIGAVLALAVTLVVDADAGVLKKLLNKKGRSTEAPKTKAVAAMYSGTLRGEIRVGKQKVQIGDRTMIYVIGRGQAKKGITVKDRPVSVMGESIHGVLLADMVIIRPEMQNNTSPLTGSSDAHGRTVTRSDSNPNVGIVEPGDYE